MMYSKKRHILGTIICSLLLLGCNKEVVEKNAVVHGRIENIHNDRISGYTITLQNVSDPSLKYIAVSDANNEFNFEDIVAGIYSVDVVKVDHEINLIWMTDDGKTNHRDKLIELKDGQVKELTITLTEWSVGLNSQFKLELTDINGKPIGGSVSVPKYSTTIAFRLYNGTDSEQYWDVSPDYCFVSGFINYQYYFEDIFSSFSQTSGRLKPGDTVVLVGTINQEIFKIIDNREWLSTIYFVSIDNYRIGRRDVYLDIEF